jgi:murein DD-endopeptidase MepM/ murein hydrolase activator NlpD
MTSRRRYPLLAVARTLRGAAAVLGVAAFVAALIVTGRPAGQHTVTAARVASQSPAPATVTTVRQPDVTRALGLFGFSTTPPAPAHATRRVTRAEPRQPLHRWVRPNWGPLTSPFGYRWGRLHAGIDLAGPYGSTIVAATDGCISYAGPEGGYGEVLRISDWDGTETVYGHMSTFLRTSGCVRAGTPIARVGAAGDATGPHLHFEVRIGGTPVNPIPFLARRGVYV